MNIKHIFIGVGTRFPMDRLLTAMDNIVGKHDHLEAQAQIGPSNYKARHIKTQQWMSAAEFESNAKECDVFVSHAGMGNILLASKLERPIIIMPRLPELNEHINEHQLSTAEAMINKPFVHVVNNEGELENAITSALTAPRNITNAANLASREQLVQKLRDFIVDEQT